MSDYSISEMTYADVDRVTEMGARFLAEGPYGGIIKDRPKQARRLAIVLTLKNDAKVLVARDKGRAIGLFAFVLHPSLFSGEQVAGELMWYVEPEHRAGGVGLRLLAEAEREAKALGAAAMNLTAPAGGPDLGEMYGRCGYQKVEVAFQRRLD